MLVIMDVKSLYTNIEHEEGNVACYKKLETRQNKTVPSNTLKNYILLILKSNIFQFCNTFHIQKRGHQLWLLIMQSHLWKCMKHHILLTFTKKTGKKSLIWLHFIDDIFSFGQRMKAR